MPRSKRPGRPEGHDGAHVEAVQSVIVSPVPEEGGTSRPASEESVQQPVEAAPTDPTLINLYDVLVSIARADLHDYPGPKPNWYPSSFGKCDRAAVLERSGRKKNPTTDDSALFFWIGNVIHDAVQTAISKRLPGVIWHEIQARDEQYHISGKLDSLRLVQMPDGSFEPFFEVYEYKTVRTNAFNFKMPFDSHVLQVAIYLTFKSTCPNVVLSKYGVRLDHPESCTICDGSGLLPLPKRGRIAYIGKEDGRISTHVITNSLELQAAVKAKLLSLQEQYVKFQKTGEMPPMLPRVQTHVKGVPQVYKRGNAKKGIKVGDPKTELDHRTYNCDYKGQGVCCADKEKGEQHEADS